MGNKMANVAAGQVYKSNISGKLFTVLEVQDRGLLMRSHLRNRNFLMPWRTFSFYMDRVESMETAGAV